MAATYGYGGEFSSDEDIDRLEQQAERLVQSKFDSFAQNTKPTRNQIEEAIEAIRLMPLDQDVSLTDELLASLLDYYKTQRGPIVDSTRNLYKKIILRQIRGEQVAQESNGDSIKDSNGSNNNNNNNNNNSDIVDFIQKKNPIIEVVHSSDEDEPMPPVSSQNSVDLVNKKKFDGRVVYAEQPMEVDSEAPPSTQLTFRTNPVKLLETSTSDEDSDTEESSDESSDEDSEPIDMTPIKLPNQQQQQPIPQVPSKAIGPTPSKPSEVLAKKQAAVTPAAARASNAKVSVSEAKKKPYTRSQRVAATRASTSATKKTDVSSSKVEAVASDGKKPLSKIALSSYENCSNSLGKIKLTEPMRKKIIEDENGGVLGGSINGRKINYAEKMVLTAMMKQKQRDKLRPTRKR